MLIVEIANKRTKAACLASSTSLADMVDAEGISFISLELGNRGWNDVFMGDKDSCSSKVVEIHIDLSPSFLIRPVSFPLQVETFCSRTVINAEALRCNALRATFAFRLGVPEIDCERCLLRMDALPVLDGREVPSSVSLDSVSSTSLSGSDSKTSRSLGTFGQPSSLISGFRDTKSGKWQAADGPPIRPCKVRRESLARAVAAEYSSARDIPSLEVS